MPGIALVGRDSAGGLQLGQQVAKVKIRGAVPVALGDHVMAHGEPPHAPDPVMVEASSKFRFGGLRICREGDHASCGHATTGQSFFKIP
ncbi:hypothetical protein ACETRX_22850 [Labrys portucalensis]|uniref:PAAR domain-containing protein n=1 Tax=Labrys neptuniae TaxID=376174 RepID=A0ABV6ZJZ2_9HYPH